MRKGRVVVLTNRKGGIGKTTDNDMLAIVASQLFHKKVLLIDYDLQHNTTSNMATTFNFSEFRESFGVGVVNEDWERAIVQLSPYLYLIPGSDTSEQINQWISDKYPAPRNRRKQYLVFVDQLNRLRENFDYIFFDCPPSTDQTVKAFLTAADYVVPLQELKRFAMDGTDEFLNKVLVPIVEAFPEETKVQVIGLLPVLFSPRRKNQKKNLEKTREIYGTTNIFHTIIKGSDRLEGYGETGIQLNDYIDRRMWAVFADVFAELESRIQYYEENGDMEGFHYELKFANSEYNHTLPGGKEIEINGIVTAQ
jgi:cellulose biosynthesis protein BcsQ